MSFARPILDSSGPVDYGLSPLVSVPFGVRSPLVSGPLGCPQEQSLGIHYNEGGELKNCLVNPVVFQYKDGYVDIPAVLGWG